MCACSPVRFATIRAMWKTGFRIALEYPRALMANTVVYTSVYLVSYHFLSINRPQDEWRNRCMQCNICQCYLDLGCDKSFLANACSSQIVLPDQLHETSINYTDHEYLVLPPWYSHSHARSNPREQPLL